MNKKTVRQKVVVGAVICHRGKILLLKRSKTEDSYAGYWELPSGKREFLESCSLALIREVKEETGLSIKPITPFSTFEYQLEKVDYIIDTTQIDFMAKIIGKPEIKLSAEHDNYSWISLAQIHSYKISESIKKELISAFKITSR